MIKFYSSHCSKCRRLEEEMKKKNIKFELIDNEDTYLPIAREHGIMSMPFADIDGKIINTVALQKYINGGN